MIGQRGFILPLTLWILAAIAIAAGTFAERMLTALELAAASRQRVQSLIDISNTRAEILFRLGTTPMSVYGLGELQARSVALDDRPYRGEGQDLLRLQDDRGLFNLSFADEDSLYRLLGVLNVPSGQRNRLIDIFSDYTDEDDFKHLNGAESRDYAAVGYPPPRNDKLVTPYEARNMLVWRDLPQLWQTGGLAELTVTGTSSALNPNTAPWQVLITLPGMTEDVARKLIALRKQAPIQSAGDVTGMMGVPSANFVMQIIAFPSDSLRVTQSLQGQAWALRYNVSLTPFDERAPWRIDYHYKIESPYADVPIESVPRLPEKSTLPANSSPSVLPF